MGLMQSETVLRGVVTDVDEAEVLVDGLYPTGGNPGRTNFTIKVLDGPDELFCDWLECLADWSIVRYGKTMRFSEICNGPWVIKNGTVIELPYGRYLEARLDFLASCAIGKLNGDLATLSRQVDEWFEGVGDE